MSSSESRSLNLLVRKSRSSLMKQCRLMGGGQGMRLWGVGDHPKLVVKLFRVLVLARLSLPPTPNLAFGASGFHT